MTSDEQLPEQDVFALEGLISWLETVPSDDEYNWHSATDCLLCQYFRAQGLPVNSLGISKITLRDGQSIPIPHRHDNPFHDVACREPYTFGAALSRARDLAEAS